MGGSNHGQETIAFALGGTGGHVLPALSIARDLPGEGKRILIGVGVCQNPFIPQKEFDCFNVCGKNFSKGVFSGMFSISKGVKEAVKILRNQNCTHVIGMGGYHSLPVLIAALYLRIPISLYEPNLIPGKVNKVFSMFSKRTFILFEETKKSLHGMSLLLELSSRDSRKEELPSKKLLQKEFGLDDGVTTVLVFGGSLGAATINNIMEETLKCVTNTVQVLHLSGASTEIKQIYERLNIKYFTTTFLKDMDKAWKVCDFAICRSGASTIKEAIVYKKPVILIPYPNAVKDHQKHNANFMQHTVGGGVSLLEKDLTEKKLASHIDQFCCIKARGDMEKEILRYTSTRKGKAINGILL
jgi:UDP-N-acetylglucosamine--N-acetylmuramyl-(pentapeptide) pyrophosphoryl-undecaprenol N-acetylglucosamine transferase